MRDDRIAGCMYGAAIGDALGSAFEFVDASAIEAQQGEPIVRRYVPALAGSLLYPRAPGRPTDDTAMALSVATTLASGAAPTAEAFAQRFLTDLDRQYGAYGAMFWEGGPGGATTRALRRLRAGADPACNGHNEDGGNGAAMRAHPVGLLARRDDVLEVAALQARVTHGHLAAIAAAQAVAVLVYDALHDEPLSAQCPPGITDGTFVASWHELHRDLSCDGLRLPPRLRNVAMSGWETVAAAHAIVMCFPDDPATALGVAAASGGDTDTVASIAGALAGARAGLAALEFALVIGLEGRELIDDAVACLQTRYAPQVARCD